MKTILIVALCCLFSTGCASYNQKLICGNVATNNAALPYVGGQSSGYVTACYYSYLGWDKSIKADDGSVLAKAVAAAISQTNNKIITSGPVIITATPVK